MRNIYLFLYTRIGTLIVATIYLQLIQNRYSIYCITMHEIDTVIAPHYFTFYFVNTLAVSP